MTVLPLHSSGNLLLNDTTTSNSGYVKFSPISSSAATTISYKPKPLHSLIIDNGKNKPNGITELLEQSSSSVRTSDKPSREEDAVIASVMLRLERVTEMLIESETRNFKEKLLKGKTLSEDEIGLVETMSREIVTKLIEEPIRYLKSQRACGGGFDQRVQDLNFLVEILEESCYGKREKNGKMFQYR